MDKEAFKKVALRIFAKHGGDGEYVKAFDNLADADKEQILQTLGLDEDETAVIGGIFQGRIFLITNLRMLQTGDQRDTSVMLSQLNRLKPVDHAKVKLTKDEFAEINTYLNDGSQQTFLLEGARAFIGIWNVLLRITARNNSSEN